MLTVLLNFTCYGPSRPCTVSQCRALRIEAPAAPGRHMHVHHRPDETRFLACSFCYGVGVGRWPGGAGVGWRAEREDEGGNGERTNEAGISACVTK